MTTVVSPAVAVGRRRSGRLARRRELISYGLVAPALILSIGIVVVPGIFTLILSFTDWSGVGGTYNFIGIDNFKERKLSAKYPQPWGTLQEFCGAAL